MRVIPFTSPLTDEEALAVLNEGGGWYMRKNNSSGYDQPDWWGSDTKAIIKLDGDFTRDELLALLHFHPEDKQ